jgi:hypothetical protein
VTWQAFVLEHGWHAHGAHLAAVLEQPLLAIARLRQSASCRRLAKAKTFGDLFALWRGRPPRDEEWPAPRKIGGGYEWLAPELALLASLVGRLGAAEIAGVLTTRLRRLTGDRRAVRPRNAIWTASQRVGLIATDVAGGLTAHQAGREIGCVSIIYNEIRHGRLKTVRVGRLLVIPRDEWARWKGTRVFPPKGYVQLSRLKRPLGIRSDKLSEWARLGYVPTAIRCNPYGARAASTMFGTWWIDPKIVTKLTADRRAGRAMPWWGQPEPGNLKITWTLLQQRQHPARCATCRAIWGPAGAPRTFDDYMQRYPPLAFGAKRHLTRVWSDGLSVSELARDVNLPSSLVLSAIRTGVLRATRVASRYVITRTDATRWKFRRCPTGRGRHCWMQISAARQTYGFSRAEIAAHIKAGRLTSKIGACGPQRGLRYVLRQQIRELRETSGFPAADAARRLGISVARLKTFARYADWRDPHRYTLDVITTIRKRMESEAGLTIAQAARKLRKSVRWVEREIANGTARVLRTPFKTTRRYISGPMFRRLQAAVTHPTPRLRWSSEWLLVSDAALLAGVCSNTVQRWADLGQVRIRFKARFRRYHRRSVIARARLHWTTERRRGRAPAPAWLQTPEAA